MKYDLISDVVIESERFDNIARPNSSTICSLGMKEREREREREN